MNERERIPRRIQIHPMQHRDDGAPKVHIDTARIISPSRPWGDDRPQVQFTEYRVARAGAQHRELHEHFRGRFDNKRDATRFMNEQIADMDEWNRSKGRSRQYTHIHLQTRTVEVTVSRWEPVPASWPDDDEERNES